ncbi:nuclear transport factor 2 family protein [Rhodococcus hoagii]|nr:nuclear transport factor 2 family protein [Prescottella equi]
MIDSYVKHLGNHDVDELVALFATDAVQHEPLGVRTYRGIDEIREFDTANAKVAFHGEPSLADRRLRPVRRDAVARAARGMPDFLASDLFEFDDTGKIVSLSVVLDPEAQV